MAKVMQRAERTTNRATARPPARVWRASGRRGWVCYSCRYSMISFSPASERMEPMWLAMKPLTK